jgi:hypothetical protein
MLFSTLSNVIDDRVMPKLPELLFLSASIVLALVVSFRTSAHRRAWKRSLCGGPQQRYKMPVSLEIETRLYFLGALICWEAGSPGWAMRAISAVIALAGVFILLYRNNLKTQDAPPYDAESVLHLPQENAKAV